MAMDAALINLSCVSVRSDLLAKCVGIGPDQHIGLGAVVRTEV